MLLIIYNLISYIYFIYTTNFIKKNIIMNFDSTTTEQYVYIIVFLQNSIGILIIKTFAGFENVHFFTWTDF